MHHVTATATLFHKPEKLQPVNHTHSLNRYSAHVLLPHPSCSICAFATHHCIQMLVMCGPYKPCKKLSSLAHGCTPFTLTSRSTRVPRYGLREAAGMRRRAWREGECGVSNWRATMRRGSCRMYAMHTACMRRAALSCHSGVCTRARAKTCCRQIPGVCSTNVTLRINLYRRFVHVPCA